MKKQLKGVFLAILLGLPSLTYSSPIKTFNSPEGYAASVRIEENKDNTNLVTRVTDSDSELNVVDVGNNGLNDGDYMTFRHDFSTKERLEFKITYKGHEHYLSAAQLYSTNKTELVKCELDTRKINRVVYYFVKKLSKSTLEETHKLYADIVNSTLAGQQSSIPYDKIKKGFIKFEDDLPRVRESDKKFEKGLIGLIKEYSRIINQKKNEYADLLFSCVKYPSKG
jgi:hypothetical protein